MMQAPDDLDKRIAQLQAELAAPTEVAPVNVTAPSLANAPMGTAGGDVDVDRQIAALRADLENTNPNMSLPEDMARSATTGVQHGVSGLLGMFGDGAHLGQAAAMYLLQQGGRLAGVPEEKLKAGPPLPVGFPTSQGIDKLRQTVAGPDHTPQTTAGKYAEAIGTMVPGAALGPGGMLAKGALAVTSGAGSQLAGDVAKDMGATPGLEAGARAAGALVGGGVAGAGRALTAAPERLVGQAMEGVAPAQAQAAANLMREAEARGVQLTMAEALQQVTGGATGMGRMQRVIEGTKRGGQALAPVMAERPGQVRGAAQAYADTIAPPNANPSMIGPRAQQAAQGGLDTVRQGINAKAKPYYDAMAGEVKSGPGVNRGGVDETVYVDRGGQSIPLDALAPLAKNTAFQQALSEVRGDKLLNAGIAKLPDNDVSVLNEVQKQIDRNIEAFRQTAQNPGGNNYKASMFQSARDQLDALAAKHSPQWRAARDTVAQGREQYLSPLEAGPAGSIARTDNVPAQTGALYPAKPLEGAANETGQAIRLMNGVDPTVPPDLLRQHLANTIEGTMGELQGGPNPYAGAKFAKAIAGGQGQADVLRTGVSETAGPQSAADLDQLLEVLRATGKRQPQGSLTAFNAKDLEDMGVSAIEKIGANPFKAAGQVVSAASQRMKVDALARALLSNPTEAEAFMHRAMGQRGSGANTALMAALLSGQAAQGGQ